MQQTVHLQSAFLWKIQPCFDHLRGQRNLCTRHSSVLWRECLYCIRQDHI